MLGVSQSRGLKLFGCEVIFEEFKPIWTRYLNVTDRRTDRQTDGRHAISSPRSALASRGKNLKFRFFQPKRIHVFVTSQWKPHDAAVNFDTCQNLQRHHVVLPAIARPSCFIVPMTLCVCRIDKNTLCLLTTFLEHCCYSCRCFQFTRYEWSTV